MSHLVFFSSLFRHQIAYYWIKCFHFQYHFLLWPIWLVIFCKNCILIIIFLNRSKWILKFNFSERVRGKEKRIVIVMIRSSSGIVYDITVVTERFIILSLIFKHYHWYFMAVFLFSNLIQWVFVLNLITFKNKCLW